MSQEEVQDLLPAIAGDSSIGSWTDEKKVSFCKTFTDRVAFAMAVLAVTGKALIQESRRRYFVSEGKDFQDFECDYPSCTLELVDGQLNLRTHSKDKFGGRNATDVINVALMRVTELIRALPDSVNTIRIIKPEVAKMMDERRRLSDEACKQRNEFNDVSKTYVLDEDYIRDHGDMKISEFLQATRKRAQRRVALAKSLAKLNVKLTKLENEVNKALHKGIPQLEKATEEVISGLRQEMIAYGQMGRRVTEQVQFGDSAVAAEALSKFERDEERLAPEFAKRLHEAVDAIRQSAKRKALKGPKSK